MKLPETPTNPYIKHNPHTLGDAKNRAHGIGPTVAGAIGRCDAINSRSAVLTCGISSGRLRNHNQKKTHQTTPSPAMSVSGIAQPWKTLVMSHTTKSGAIAPPSR